MDRARYLAQAVGAKHSPAVVEAAIATTPAAAGLTARQIEKIAKKSLGKDGRRTTALSFAAGLPGGVAGAVTIPADLVQFYGYLIRAIQKLSYLYGWRDLVHVDAERTDVATASALVIFLGVMADVEKANDTLARLARLRESGAVDARLRTALAARTMQEEVNAISTELTRRMARRLTGQVAGKAIPVVGGIVSGVITGSGFDEMAKRLLRQAEREKGSHAQECEQDIEHFGNTSAGTIPLALWEYESRLRKGDNMIFTAFGAGFVHGASYMKWGYDGQTVNAPVK